MYLQSAVPHGAVLPAQSCTDVPNVLDLPNVLELDECRVRFARLSCPRLILGPSKKNLKGKRKQVSFVFSAARAHGLARAHIRGARAHGLVRAHLRGARARTAWLARARPGKLESQWRGAWDTRTTLARRRRGGRVSARIAYARTWLSLGQGIADRANDNP